LEENTIAWTMSAIPAIITKIVVVAEVLLAILISIVVFECIS